MALLLERYEIARRLYADRFLEVFEGRDLADEPVGGRGVSTGDVLLGFLAPGATFDAQQFRAPLPDVLTTLRGLATLDDARVPRLIREAGDVGGRALLVFAHPRFVHGPDLFRRAAEMGGLAFPLAFALMRDLCDVVAKMQATRGRAFLPYIESWSIAASADGDFICLPVVHHELDSFINEEADVILLASHLAQGDPRDDTRRGDLPAPFTALVTRARRFDATLRDLVALVGDPALRWALWSKAQVAAELRALFPELG